MKMLRLRVKVYPLMGVTVDCSNSHQTPSSRLVGDNHSTREALGRVLARIGEQQQEETLNQWPLASGKTTEMDLFIRDTEQAREDLGLNKIGAIISFPNSRASPNPPTFLKRTWGRFINGIMRD